MPLGNSHGGDRGSREWTDGYDDVDISGPPLYTLQSNGQPHRAACRPQQGPMSFVRAWAMSLLFNPYLCTSLGREKVGSLRSAICFLAAEM